MKSPSKSKKKKKKKLRGIDRTPLYETPSEGRAMQQPDATVDLALMALSQTLGDPSIKAMNDYGIASALLMSIKAPDNVWWPGEATMRIDQCKLVVAKDRTIYYFIEGVCIRHSEGLKGQISIRKGVYREVDISEGMKVTVRFMDRGAVSAARIKQLHESISGYSGSAFIEQGQQYHQSLAAAIWKHQLLVGKVIKVRIVPAETVSDKYHGKTLVFHNPVIYQDWGVWEDVAKSPDGGLEDTWGELEECITFQSTPSSTDVEEKPKKKKKKPRASMPEVPAPPKDLKLKLPVL